jgi:replicative DNA helicase
MVQVALARRLLAQSARVSASALKSGRIGDGEWVLIRSTLPKLKTLPLWLTDQTVSLDEITTIVEGFADTPPLRLLIIDYLQLVRAPDTVRERRLQVEYVSQGLKALALAQGFPILCLSSLSRTSAETKEKRPTLDRLRESGELEHDADIVLFLHREFDKAETEVIVAKNRDGRTGTAHLLFRPEYVAFDEPSERPDPDA